MNKTELIEHIAKNADISKAAATRALDAAIGAVTTTLKKGEHIRVTLIIGALKGKAYKALEVTCLVIATLLSGFLAFFRHCQRLVALQLKEVST